MNWYDGLPSDGSVPAGGAWYDGLHVPPIGSAETPEGDLTLPLFTNTPTLYTPTVATVQFVTGAFFANTSQLRPPSLSVLTAPGVIVGSTDDYWVTGVVA